MAEYRISGAVVSDWVRSYREVCQNNGEEKSQLEMMEELYDRSVVASVNSSFITNSLAMRTLEKRCRVQRLFQKT